MNRFKQLRIEHGYETQAALAQKLYVNQTAVSQWERGVTTPNPNILLKLSKMYNVSTDYLLGNDRQDQQDSNFIPYCPTGTVPVLGRIAAGVPISAIEEVEGYEPVTVSDPENCYYLRVEGDSMIGAGIQSGDLVLIRQQPTADSGQIVACKVNGDEATLKRFRQQGETVFLMPENPNYEPIIVPAKDFETGHAQIFGVAIEVKRKL
ncbi:transcriptional repressor LexA [Candidatus Avoscillospira sp. LCP25S3_F1]|uniref:transcriptional repressor LexA n=1 Tax=Candidatus Avoscillospira sp. LCP25S3_F1 TaxID=3438825 RepID=UPI003F9293C8